MRVLVTVNPGMRELYEDLAATPARFRAERLRTLAQRALTMSGAHGGAPAGRAGATTNTSGPPSLNAGDNKSLTDDSD